MRAGRWLVIGGLTSCAVSPTSDSRSAESSRSVPPSGSTNTLLATKTGESVGGSSSSAVSAPNSAGSSNAGAASAPGANAGSAGASRMLELGRGLDSVQKCLKIQAELRVAPKPLYQSSSVKRLAVQLGFRPQPDAAPIEAFCEPALWPDQCAYSNCSASGAALTWQKIPKSYGLAGLLILEERGGRASAYRLGVLELNDPEFACHCWSSEFGAVSRPAPGLLVAEFYGQTRMGRMCSEAFERSTWLLDDAMHPILAVFERNSWPPARVEVTRSQSELRVRIENECEAVVDLSEFAQPAKPLGQ